MVYFLQFGLFLAVVSLGSNVASSDNTDTVTRRLRKPDAAIPEHHRAVSSILDSTVAELVNLDETETTEEKLDEIQDAIDALLEAFEKLELEMSCDTSESPSEAPSGAPFSPSTAPSAAPSGVGPSVPSSAAPIGSPTTDALSDAPSSAPSDAPSATPSKVPTTSNFTAFPTPLAFPPPSPLVSPTPAPVPAITNAPTPFGVNFTDFPSACPGITSEERVQQILAILDAVADPDDIRDNGTPQGLATTWLIETDELQVCPTNAVSCQLIQRWSLAVIYFSTNGNDWTQCSANPNATDLCGSETPFVGKSRFLGPESECDWAGISCLSFCVSEIEFERNNLNGTIPTEIGLLTDLAIWGMEQGFLTSTIPTEIGILTNLIFLDLDFNQLTGTLTSELLSLTSLTQLDLNNNGFSGSIDGIGVFPEMEFLQLHANNFTGTVPEAVGTYTRMTAFTLHDSSISGTMPQSVCDLRVTAGTGGVLSSLIADCRLPNPDIICNCCSDCRGGSA